MPPPNHDTPLPAEHDTRVLIAALSAKLDYLVQGQQTQATEMREVRVEMRDLRRLVDAVPGEVDRQLDRKMDAMVRLESFEPVRNLVYGLVGLVLVALVGAAMAIILGGRGVAP